VRLERDRSRDDRTIIHNYGHGGSGFTLSWGCAREALDLAT
jgi:D-amino-acid oxidase